MVSYNLHRITVETAVILMLFFLYFQGQFKIDLTRTSFRVSRTQQWHSYGLQTSTKISVSQVSTTTAVFE